MGQLLSGTRKYAGDAGYQPINTVKGGALPSHCLLKGFSLSRHSGEVARTSYIPNRSWFWVPGTVPCPLWCPGASHFPSPLLQVLVLGNKRDLPGALDEKELIEKM